MSHRIDRSLGVKPYNNAGGVTPPVRNQKSWSLKVTSVLKALLIIALATGAVTVLVNTNDCSKEVRCAD
ncbi:putative membrane protein [Stenotrophomonas phage C121]|uniref:hypothetical protein n=1 Tax=Stenotrophomonas phage C121 TaxID=2914029 RepID=UPI0023299D22|nr:hypothetical protein PP752_gp10 [Stenotrophomonas phage C121]UKL14743.1 putative membrane protein [Stenotrophomonas phage C121]